VRTTIRIEDELYRRVKTRAAATGRTVGDVIEDAIRYSLDALGAGGATGEPTPLPVYGGSGVMPGVDLADSAALRELLDEGRGLDALR
jgi:hypothetical protein